MSSDEYYFVLTMIGIGIGLIHFLVRNCTTCPRLNLCYGCLRINRQSVVDPCPVLPLTAILPAVLPIIKKIENTDEEIDDENESKRRMNILAEREYVLEHPLKFTKRGSFTS